MSTISEEYKQKFTLSDNANPFINPPPRQDPENPVLYPNLLPSVFDPICDPEEKKYAEIPQPPVVTYSKMKWNTKTPLNNPYRPLNMSAQNLIFTKNLILPRRTTILTNNVPKNVIINNCYTPVNNNVYTTQ